MSAKNSWDWAEEAESALNEAVRDCEERQGWTPTRVKLPVVLHAATGPYRLWAEPEPTSPPKMVDTDAPPKPRFRTYRKGDACS